MALQLKWSMLFVLLFAVASTARADDTFVSGARDDTVATLQTTDDYEDGEVPEDEVAPDEGEGDGNRPRGRMSRRSGKSASKNRHARLLEAFRDEVTHAIELDEEIEQDINRHFEKSIKELNGESDELKEERQEQADKMRELVTELREAQRSGETERVAEVRDEITRIRRSGGSSDFNFNGFVEELKELVYEDQVGEVERIARRYQSKFKSKKSGPADMLRQVRQAMAGLDLSREQHEVTREIFAEYTRELREAREDDERSHEVFEDLCAAITDELDDDQATQFKERLEKLRSKNDSRGERGRERRRTADLHSATGADLGDAEVLEDDGDMPADIAEYRDENPYDDEEPEE